MQTILQDLTEYLPMVGGLSPPLRRELQQHLLPLAPVIVGVAFAFIVAAVAVLAKMMAATVFIPFFMILISPFLMLLQGRKTETGTASFEFRGLKFGWQGGLAFAFLVTGVLLLGLVEWTKT